MGYLNRVAHFNRKIYPDNVTLAYVFRSTCHTRVFRSIACVFRIPVTLKVLPVMGFRVLSVFVRSP